MEISRLTRDETAEPVSRDQILRHARGQGIVHIPCSADHEQDWQPYPVDPYSAICDDHTYIHILILHTQAKFTLPISARCQFIYFKFGEIYNTRLILLFLTFSVLVANPKNYFTRWPIPLVVC